MGVSLIGPDFMWLTTADAAKRLGVRTSSVRKAVKRGLIEGYEFGREIAIRDRDVESYKRRRLATGRPAKGFKKD